MVLTVLQTQNSITFTLNNGSTFMVSSSHPHWDDMCARLMLGDLEGAYQTIQKNSDALSQVGWKIVDGLVQDTEGRMLPDDLSNRIIEMIKEERPLTPLVLFWKSLVKNPSKRSVDSLWGFLDHEGIPVGEDGRIIGYKAVRPDFLDIYSKTFLNEPGAHFKMDRNRVSDDPKTACHEGFHVGSLDYAKNFACSVGVIVIVAVEPEHVVCVPYDHECGKMRVCEYTVLGLHNGEALPNTVLEDDDIPYTKPVFIDAESIGEPQECALGNPKYATQTDPNVVAISTTVPGSDQWITMNTLGKIELLGYSFKDLRRYSTQHLKVVGVSKMKGTKEDLVEKILQWRR